MFLKSTTVVVVLVVMVVILTTSASGECSWSDKVCPGYKRVCIAGRWTYWILAGVTAALMAAGVAGGAGALLFQGVGFIIAQVLGLFGFLPGGVAAGGFAAWIQGVMGPIQAGGLFAFLQGLGAQGLAPAGMVAALCTYFAHLAVPLVVAKLFDLTCYLEKE